MLPLYDRANIVGRPILESYVKNEVNGLKAYFVSICSTDEFILWVRGA